MYIFDISLSSKAFNSIVFNVEGTCNSSILLFLKAYAPIDVIPSSRITFLIPLIPSKALSDTSILSDKIIIESSHSLSILKNDPHFL